MHIVHDPQHPEVNIVVFVVQVMISWRQAKDAVEFISTVHDRRLCENENDIDPKGHDMDPDKPCRDNYGQNASHDIVHRMEMMTCQGHGRRELVMLLEKVSIWTYDAKSDEDSNKKFATQCTEDDIFKDFCKRWELPCDSTKGDLERKLL